MINIFLSYCGKDKKSIDTIIDNLNLRPNLHNLWYYQLPDKNSLSMEEILNKLVEIDIFVLFITDNSLNSDFVQQELLEAIRLAELGLIIEICPIIIDDSITSTDNRVPIPIKNNLQHAQSPILAAELIEKVLHKYLMDTGGI